MSVEGGPDQYILLPGTGRKQSAMATVPSVSYSIGWGMGCGTMRRSALFSNLNATPVIGTILILVPVQTSSTSGIRGSCIWANCILLYTAGHGTGDFAVLSTASCLLPLHIKANVCYGSEPRKVFYHIRVYDRSQWWAASCRWLKDYCCRLRPGAFFSIATQCFAKLLLWLAYT